MGANPNELQLSGSGIEPDKRSGGRRVRSVAQLAGGGKRADGRDIVFNTGGSITASGNTVTLSAASGEIKGNNGAGADITAAMLVQAAQTG
ncbi:MAG: hypothetical protein KF778_14165 [Rhodocyclaceae bacterium]|nr:hypothetical protein [Rhodocyclaceae bacterium]